MDLTTITITMIIILLALAITLFAKKARWIAGIIIIIAGLNITLIPNITTPEKININGTIGNTTIDINTTTTQNNNTTDNQIAYLFTGTVIIMSGLGITLRDIITRTPT